MAGPPRWHPKAHQPRAFHAIYDDKAPATLRAMSFNKMDCAASLCLLSPITWLLLQSGIFSKLFALCRGLGLHFKV